jgi:U3 small nucleolar RNA-associated protein 7
MQFSQRGLLGVSFGNRVEVYPDPTKAAIVHPYMKHSVFKTVSQIQFCPYEDILGELS